MIVARVLQVVYAATPLICWRLNACLGKRRVHWALLFVIAGITGYFVLLAAVQAMELALDVELYKHDLDGDRSFSESEMTEEAKRAMNRVTNDTGRTLAPITGVPITFVWTFINFIVLGIVETIGRWLWSRLRRPKAELEKSISFPTSSVPLDTSNPYQPPIHYP